MGGAGENVWSLVRLRRWQGSRFSPSRPSLTSVDGMAVASGFRWCRLQSAGSAEWFSQSLLVGFGSCQDNLTEAGHNACILAKKVIVAATFV